MKFPTGGYNKVQLSTQLLSPNTLPFPLIEQRVQQAIAAVQASIPVVLTDDYDRENEADLILAAERITEATMAQLIRDGSGIVCLCMNTNSHTPCSNPSDLSRPGHVYPLRAHPDGIRRRQGHTEGSVYLVELAGLRSAAVLCELMNHDGTMMRGDALLQYAQ